MRRRVGVVLAGVVALTCAFGQSARSAQIVMLETEGNLASTAPLGCVDLGSVTPAQTPADIIPGVRKCLDSSEYAKAADLFAVFRAFGKFDTLRVADKSAHQGLLVLQMNFLDKATQESKTAVQELIKKFVDPTSAELMQLCKHMKAIGPPSYVPTYMLQHGISAFTGQGAGLVQGFDAKVAWGTTLDGYLHCPP
jgi:hypothetical protein